jgi:hypothetical protein
MRARARAEEGGGGSEDIYAADGVKGAATLAVPARSRACAPAPLEPPRALAFVPREPGCPETTFIYVSRQPGSAGPFAHVGPGPTPDAGNQTCRTCIPRARLGHMHLTKRALKLLPQPVVSSVSNLTVQDSEDTRTFGALCAPYSFNNQT